MLYREAIDTFFAASLQPQRWPDALDDIAQALGADAATLVAGSTSLPTVAWSRRVSTIVEDYFDMNEITDTREDRVRPSYQAGFCGDFDFYTTREISLDPFYQEFLKPRGFGWHAVALLDDGTQPLHLSLKRRFSAGPFERSELVGMGKLLDHMRGAAQAVHLGLSAKLDGCLEALASMRRGGVLLDAGGRVLRHNSAIEFNDGVSVVKSRLRAAFSCDQRALARAVAIATCGTRPSELPAPAPVILHRPSGKRALILQAFTLWGVEGSPLAPARAMVSVIDPARTRMPATQLLIELYHLAPNEARLAGLLAEGRSLDDAADKMRITRGHARQRLKNIFQKTDTARQGELVALLARLC
jgi:DNA-binding CsgD family transcriptional regulator